MLREYPVTPPPSKGFPATGKFARFCPRVLMADKAKELDGRALTFWWPIRLKARLGYLYGFVSRHYFFMLKLGQTGLYYIIACIYTYTWFADRLLYVWRTWHIKKCMLIGLYKWKQIYRVVYGKVNSMPQVRFYRPKRAESIPAWSHNNLKSGIAPHVTSYLVWWC